MNDAKTTFKTAYRAARIAIKTAEGNYHAVSAAARNAICPVSPNGSQYFAACTVGNFAARAVHARSYAFTNCLSPWAFEYM